MVYFKYLHARVPTWPEKKRARVGYYIINHKAVYRSFLGHLFLHSSAVHPCIAVSFLGNLFIYVWTVAWAYSSMYQCWFLGSLCEGRCLWHSFIGHHILWRIVYWAHFFLYQCRFWGIFFGCESFPEHIFLGAVAFLGHTLHCVWIVFWSYVSLYISGVPCSSFLGHPFLSVWVISWTFLVCTSAVCRASFSLGVCVGHFFFSVPVYFFSNFLFMCGSLLWESFSLVYQCRSWALFVWVISLKEGLLQIIFTWKWKNSPHNSIFLQQMLLRVY